MLDEIAVNAGYRNTLVNLGLMVVEYDGLEAQVTEAGKELAARLNVNGDSRRADASRKGARPKARTDVRGSRKPALAASTKAGNRSRYGFTASSNRRSKKRA